MIVQACLSAALAEGATPAVATSIASAQANRNLIMWIAIG
jgi:hypothetical protein